MSFALSVIVKTTIVLACASLMTLALRRASASARHAVWAIALLSALILPIASTVLPELALPILPEETLSSARTLLSEETAPLPRVEVPAPGPPASATAIKPAHVQSPPAIETDGFGLPRRHTVLFFWMVGASIVFLRLILGGLAIRR